MFRRDVDDNTLIMETNSRAVSLKFRSTAHHFNYNNIMYGWQCEDGKIGNQCESDGDETMMITMRHDLQTASIDITKWRYLSTENTVAIDY